MRAEGSEAQSAKADFVPFQRRVSNPSIHNPSLHNPPIHDPSIHDPAIHDPAIRS